MNHTQQIRQQQNILELKAKEIMESENTWQWKYFELHKLIIVDRGLREAEIILNKLNNPRFEYDG